MEVSVIYAGFTIGVCSFGIWLLVMLRHNRVHRFARLEASQERARAHRRATLAARYEPTPVPAPTPELVPTARVGSFCRVPGNLGYDKHGDALVCTETATGRPRWRRVAVHAA